MTTDLSFDEPEDSAADDMAGVVFLAADNKDELLSRFEQAYLFDAEPGRPREGFYVRMATLSVMQTFERLNGAKNVNSTQQFQALCKLVADSVVDPSGDPIWTEDEIKSMGSANVPRFMRLQACVMDRNGLKKLDELVDDAAKN